MQRETTFQIVKKAQSFGASLAGIVRVSELRGSPSVRASGSDMFWLLDNQSVLVAALEHPIKEPELDWWGTEGGTEGNYRLRIICERLRSVLAREFNIKSQRLKYQPGDMGIYLKDAAVLAGLGVIGANNLLITPQHGPRVRLLGLLLDAEIPATEAMQFSPCETCGRPCLSACPQQAFRSGSYDRTSCSKQMQKDESNRTTMETDQWGRVACIKYCRACELACPLGK